MVKLAHQRFALPPPKASRAEATVLASEALAGKEPPPAPIAQVGQALKAACRSVPLLEDYDLPPAGSPVDVMVDHLKVLAAKEPERVAEVVKQWVQKNVRASRSSLGTSHSA